jgi:tRNA nucleotidyltransferase (CCA-adding enzyme)
MSTKLQANTIITAHNNADFDCLSSMVAARTLYPDAVLVFPGSQEQSLRDFFIQSATYLYNFYSMRDIDPASVKKVIVCDTRQKSRLPHLEQALKNEGLEVHVYDHHPDTSDDLESSLSVVRPWGATVSVIIDIIRDKGLDVSPEDATIMGLGLYEDTGCFTFSSTTEDDLKALLWLKQKGMDIGYVADFLNRELSAEQVAILNNILESASNHTINGIEICITQVTTDRYVHDFALLVHKMMEIESIKVLFAMALMQDRVHVVARSHIPNVDAGKICSSLGGGGHTYAASATIKDKTLAQVQDELFGLLYSHINPQITVRSLMSSPPIMIRDQTSISQASTVMTRYGLKAIPVVASRDSSHCVGILEHQLADRAQSHGLGEFEVQEYMRRNFQQVKPGESLYKVMEIIIDQGQRLVPVEEDDHLIGVITRTDLIHWLVEEPARIPESLLPERTHERNIKSLMRNRLPAEIFNLLKKAGELAQKMGCHIYAVGGFVRDILLQHPNLDIDLVVEGDGIEFASAFAHELGGRLRAHKKFRTAVVILPNKQRIDVATARLEYYEHPAALPTVELSSIKLDLFRRDFSINALAIELNPKNFGRLVDFFGGQRDIKEKVIRVLHSLSFVEDPTRVLRAIRFEQRFNFRIGGQTERLIKNAINLNMFHKLSGSRIFQELRLILEERSPLICLKRMEKLDLLQSIHPLLKLTTGKEKVLEKIEKVMDWFELLYIEPKPDIWKVYFLGLCFGSNNDQVSILARRFNLTPKQEANLIQLRHDIKKTRDRLYLWQNKSGSMSQLYFTLINLPLEGLLFIMASSKNEDLKKNVSLFLSQLRNESIEISGKDLKALGLPPGPAYNRIMNHILTDKLDGRAGDRSSQLARAMELVQDELKKQGAGESSASHAADSNAAS